MATDIATIRLRFPEFSDNVEYPDPRIQLFIDDSTLHMGTDESRWCGKYNLAQAYMTAHLLSSGTSTEAGDSSGKAGPISSKSAGGVSVSRAVVAKDRSDVDTFYSSTAYGQQFLVIRRMCFAGVLTASPL